MNIPYSLRVCALVAFSGLIVAVDFARNGKKASRWKDFSMLLLLGCVAALCGVILDTITSSISATYFSYREGHCIG